MKIIRFFMDEWVEVTIGKQYWGSGNMIQGTVIIRLTRLTVFCGMTAIPKRLLSASKLLSTFYNGFNLDGMRENGGCAIC
jgi:hypothetical protein